MMKVVRLEIQDELHSNIKLYCKAQKICMHSFMPELMDKGWKAIETVNGNILYNDDGTPKNG